MSNYITTEGQTVFDIALAIYGDAQGLSILLANNNNIDLNSVISTGTTIVYNPSVTFKKSIQVVSIPKTPTPPIITRLGQSVWDLALQLYGDVSEVNKILPYISSLNLDITVGQSFQPENNNSFQSNFGNFIYQTSQNGSFSLHLSSDDLSVTLTTDDGTTILTP